MQVFIANLVRELLAGLILTLTFWNMGSEVSAAAFLWAPALVRWQEKGKCEHPLKSEAVLPGWCHILRISWVLSVQGSVIPSVHTSSAPRNPTGEIVTNGAPSRASGTCPVNQSWHEQSLHWNQSWGHLQGAKARWGCFICLHLSLLFSA